MKFRNSFLIILLAVMQLLCNAAIINEDTKYTPQEKQALTELKNGIKNIVYKDYHLFDSYLIHYLRRKNMDVSQTKLLLQANLQWRKDKKIETILEEKAMINMKKRFPFTIDGVDKTGRPILSYTLNKWDIRRFVLTGKFEEFRRYQIYIIEKVTQRVYEIAKEENDVSQYMILIDLAGFSTRQHGCLPCLQGLGDIVTVIEDHYPNSAFQVVFINSPRVFEAIIKVVKRFLSPRQQKIIYLFGYDKNEWRTHIEKYVDAQQISLVLERKQL